MEKINNIVPGNNDYVSQVVTNFYFTTALDVQPRITDVWVGQCLNLKCAVLAVELDLDPEIYWHKRPNDKHSIQSDKSSQLVINVTTVQQAGLYFCCVRKPGQGRVCSPDAKVQVKG